MGSGYLVRRGAVGGSSEVTVTFDIQNVKIFRKGYESVLSEPRMYLVATTVGDYALFGGGNDGSYATNKVDAYDINLVRSTPTELSIGRSNLAATTVGGYALFGGGYRYSSSSSVIPFYTTVDAYDTNLVRSTPTALSEARQYLATTTIGDYALFGGGHFSSNSTSIYYTTVDAYDTNLVHSIPTELSIGRSNLTATTVGDYALFGGGYSYVNRNSIYHSTVDAYDTNLVHSAPTELSVGRSNLTATTAGNYALFAGGGPNNYEFSTLVDAYDTNLVHSTSTSLITPRSNMAGTSLFGNALFAGGSEKKSSSSGSININIVEQYDKNLVKLDQTPLFAARTDLAATTVGKYALFGGGYNNNLRIDDVESYTFNSTVQVYPGTKYKFNGMVEEETATEWKEITFNEPLNGYVKISNAEIN